MKRANTECRISSSDLYNIPQKEDTSRLGEKLHRFVSMNMMKDGYVALMLG